MGKKFWNKSLNFWLSYIRFSTIKSSSHNKIMRNVDLKRGENIDLTFKFIFCTFNKMKYHEQNYRNIRGDIYLYFRLSLCSCLPFFHFRGKLNIRYWHFCRLSYLVTHFIVFYVLHSLFCRCQDYSVAFFCGLCYDCMCRIIF